MILRFLNWSQIWMMTYLQTFGTILLTFRTNFYLTYLITLATISDHVVIPSHYLSRLIAETEKLY